MIAVITGGGKNGKSSLAQDMAAALAPGGARYYVATMIPSDDEDRARIAKHVADRDGLGFETIECGVRISDALKVNGGRGTYLLDSVTALLANEMFPPGGIDTEAGARVRDELAAFAGNVENAVFVFDGIFSDAVEYDEITETYRHWLAMCQRTLVGRSDVFIEMFAGLPVYHKGSAELWKRRADSAPLNEEKAGGRERPAESRQIMEVVIGGAYQGKVGYVRDKYGLTDEDIAVCPKDAEPDLTKRCLDHVENYVLYAMRQGVEPDLDLRDDRILIFDDFYCGVVPIDKETRLWREAAARYMTACAKKAPVVTRLVASIPQTLKNTQG